MKDEKGCSNCEHSMGSNLCENCRIFDASAFQVTYLNFVKSSYKRLTAYRATPDHQNQYAEPEIGVSNQDIYDKLAEFEDEIENGVMRKLPCKVGDKVWVLNDPYFVADIHEVVVEGIKISRDGITVLYIDDYENDYCESWADYIFKTKEAAQARLKELQEQRKRFEYSTK